jgi:FKBP-type peptidyl-prolyl cis-trans isomerase
MKRLALLVVLLIAPALAAQEKVGEKPSPFKTKKQEASYALGLQIGENLKAAGFKLDLALLAQGLADVLEEGGKPKLESERAQAVIREYHRELTMQAAAENKKEGETFLAENKQKEGVKTLESGLQYKVLKAGTGASPKATDEVTVHYSGTLTDGTKFDSSYDRGQPATFPVNGVIKGWTEALQKMKVGDKWKLFIPAELAYGEGGQGPIPPHSVLVFEVELLSIGEK